MELFTKTKCSYVAQGGGANPEMSLTHDRILSVLIKISVLIVSQEWPQTEELAF